MIIIKFLIEGEKGVYLFLESIKKNNVFEEKNLEYLLKSFSENN